ncbi:hypothetical protein ACFLQ1_00795 [Candidatus Auribacterota bacterium]
MVRLSKDFFYSFFQGFFIFIFLVTIILLSLFFLEYLSKIIVPSQEKKIVDQEAIKIKRAYPKGEFSFKKCGSFEQGNLKGWAAWGQAFKFQPTYEDNPFFRGIPLRSNIEGKFWIGTFEKRPNRSYAQGTVLGDEYIGTLTSQEFLITKPILSFLLGGGKGSNTCVELLIAGEVVLRKSGENLETMRRIKWDVSVYKEKRARICLVDYARGDWGHINFDDLKLEDAE